MQYDKNQNVSLLSDPIPIKSVTEGTKFLPLIISLSINEYDCAGAWKFVACHYANGGYKIKGIDFDQYYIPVAHADLFIINISIVGMNRLTAMILDFSNSFHNKNFPIHKIVCVITTPYYLEWFEISYPNVPLNIYYGPFFLQCMNVIQGTKQSGRKWNIILDVVVTIIKYKEITIDHSI